MNADHYNVFCYNTLRVGLDPPPLQQETDHEGGSTMQRPDQGVLFAWREGLAEAGPSQDMKQQLLQREGELLPRFAAHYDDLTHLPRSMRRRLQRHWKRSLAGVALLLVLGQTSAMAATINVGGVCTLVRAINAANNDKTATGHCKKGSGADLIVMPRNSTVTLTAVNDTTFGPTGLPTIRTNITIDGNGSTVKRASNTPNFRIFAVAHTGNLRLQETNVSGGVAVEDFGGGGGGVFNDGALTIASSTVSGNRATIGGGVSNGEYGYPSGRNTGLTIIDSNISGNSASDNGGGLYSYFFSGPVTVTNSTISGNKTAQDGGGLYTDENTSLTLVNSTVSANTAGHNGGGVSNDNDGATITLKNSTISGNKASANGGGVYVGYNSGLGIINSTLSGNTASGNGGGLHTGFEVSVLITNSTISGNIAASGGGVFNVYDGLIGLTNSTVSGNVARSGAGGGVYNAKNGIYYATLNLVHTIISGNTAPRGREVFNDKDKYGASSIVTAADYNVFGHKGLTNAQAFVGFTPSGTDITATSNGNRPTALNRILNTTLGNNGGPTRTHALVADSPAVDAVNDGTCPPPVRDQRGVKRPQDGNGDGGPACDVGSFERR